MNNSWIVVLLFLQREISGQTLSGSSTSYAVLNRPFQFTCTGSVSDTVGVLPFNRDGTSICTLVHPSDPTQCAQFTATDSYTCSCGSGGVFYMNISQVSLHDENRWRCGSGDFINLPVYYAPSIDKSSFPSTYLAVKGRQLSVNCASFTSPGRPVSTSYRWTLPDGSSTSGSTLQVNTVDRSDVGQYTCRVSNEFSSSHQGQDLASLQLTVQFPPTVSGQDPSYPVRELSPLNIDCSTYTTVGKPSSTSYRWTGPNSFSSSLAVLSISNIRRNQSGAYTCKATNTLTPTGGSTKSGIGEGQFSVDVQYLDRPHLTMDQTEVREDESVRLECSTRSHPTAALTVRNMDNDTVIIQEGDSGDLMYIIPRAQCLHNGSFVCSAEQEETGVLYSPIIQLNVLCAPRLDTRKPLKRNVSSGLDEIASLLLNVISNPAPTFHWYLGYNEQLVPIPNVTKHEIISTERYSVLQIHVTHVRDYASYVVEATSNIGTFTMRFNLLPTISTNSDPAPPDRLGLGIGIGIAAVLPIVIIGIVVDVLFRRRTCNVLRKKDPEVNQEPQIDMTSTRHDDTTGTYSDLSPTPGNEYEQLKVHHPEDSPGDYQNASNG